MTSSGDAPVTIATERDGLVLRELGEDDRLVYDALVARNREHLRAGGYASDESLALTNDVYDRWRFGVWLENELVGRVDLIPYAPPAYGSGYWLDQGHTRRGLMTQAFGAAIRFLVDEHGAEEIFAGIEHGNAASVAVAQRLGFVEVARFETYTRFRFAPT